MAVERMNPFVSDHSHWVEYEGLALVRSCRSMPLGDCYLYCSSSGRDRSFLQDKVVKIMPTVNDSPWA